MSAQVQESTSVLHRNIGTLLNSNAIFFEVLSVAKPIRYLSLHPFWLGPGTIENESYGRNLPVFIELTRANLLQIWFHRNE